MWLFLLCIKSCNRFTVKHLLVLKTLLSLRTIVSTCCHSSCSLPASSRLSSPTWHEQDRSLQLISLAGGICTLCFWITCELNLFKEGRCHGILCRYQGSIYFAFQAYSIVRLFLVLPTVSLRAAAMPAFCRIHYWTRRLLCFQSCSATVNSKGTLNSLVKPVIVFPLFSKAMQRRMIQHNSMLIILVKSGHYSTLAEF